VRHVGIIKSALLVLMHGANMKIVKTGLNVVPLPLHCADLAPCNY